VNVGIAPCILTSALYGGDWSASCPGRFTPGTHWIEAGWTPESVWTRWPTAKLRALAKNRTPSRLSQVFFKLWVVPYYRRPVSVLYDKLTDCALTEHHAIKAYWGSGGIAPRIRDLGTRWRWVVSFMPRPLHPRYPLDRRLGGPQSRSENVCQNFNFVLWFLVRRLFLAPARGELCEWYVIRTQPTFQTGCAH
jgi:hypothetical protein